MRRKVPGGYHVVGDGVMDTAFLPVVGIQEMPLHVETEVMTTGGNYEIALALDNTGSMAEHNKIGALKEAANHLIDTLYKESGSEGSREDGARALHHRRQHPRRSLQADLARPEGPRPRRPQLRQLRPRSQPPRHLSMR